MSRYFQFLWFVLLMLPALGQAQSGALASLRYLVAIELHTIAELSGALQRLETHLQSMPASSTQFEPVVFVLHGPEAKGLLPSNYHESQEFMDMAARLSAFKLVDIRVCRRWMGGSGVDQKDLPPFVTTVPYGPAEIQRLLEEENYVYF